MDYQSKQALAARAESAEALRALAAEHGISLTGEEAQSYFAMLHPPAGELSDEELEAVCGGGGGSSGGPTGFMVKGYQFAPCPQCGYNYWNLRSSPNVSSGKARYIWKCAVCDHRAREKGGGRVPTQETEYNVSRVDTPKEAWIDG